MEVGESGAVSNNTNGGQWAVLKWVREREGGRGAVKRKSKGRRGRKERKRGKEEEKV